MGTERDSVTILGVFMFVFVSVKLELIESQINQVYHCPLFGWTDFVTHDPIAIIKILTYTCNT